MIKTQFDDKKYLDKVYAWWRAANYLSVAQMYLHKNPLLHEELKAEHVKNIQLVTEGQYQDKT
ncbi:hypothetical protein NWE61_02010 [Mycoplasmopsis felis]|uniref:hypothetical protein n=1 Tax=Mycoplasmopsis felis TaxID=33923 RepID=UPI0021E04FD2|nr:hypothetical protein [Mycoplasmopsis felis]MCU9933968.1 hypothetical protein [Mycoplasmopsis felis]